MQVRSGLLNPICLHALCFQTKETHLPMWDVGLADQRLQNWIKWSLNLHLYNYNCHNYNLSYNV